MFHLTIFYTGLLNYHVISWWPMAELLVIDRKPAQGDLSVLFRTRRVVLNRDRRTEIFLMIFANWTLFCRYCIILILILEMRLNKSTMQGF